MRPLSTVLPIFLAVLFPFGCADTELVVEPEGSLELLQSFHVTGTASGTPGQPAVLTPEGIVILHHDDHLVTDAATLYDLETGKEKRTYQVYIFSRLFNQQAVAISPDGKSLAVAATFQEYGSGVAVWDIDQPLIDPNPMKGPEKDIVCLRYNSDGTRLALGGSFGVILWETGSVRREYVLQKPYFSSVTAVEFSPTGDTLLSSPPGYWSIPEKKLVEDFSQTRGRFTGAAFIDGGRKVIAGGKDLVLFERDRQEPLGNLHHYDIDNEFGEQEITSKYIGCVAASPDGKLMAAADFGGGIRIYRTDNGALVGAGTVSGEITGLDFSLFDSQLLVGWTSSGAIHVWRIHQ